MTIDRKLVLYTALVGDCDTAPPLVTWHADVPKFCFSDREDWQGKTVGGWQVLPLSDRAVCPEEPVGLEVRWKQNRNRYVARWHKLQGWQYLPVLPDQDGWVLWVDANINLKGDLERFVEVLSGLWSDVAAHRHHRRCCAYAEAVECSRLGLDHPHVLQRQCATYRSEGFPAFAGLIETSVLARKPNDKMRNFCRVWWRELCQHSFRDQVSFPYVSWKYGVPYDLLPGTVWSSEFFSKRPHRRRTPAVW